MRKSVKALATGLAALALTFAGLGISNVAAQEEFIFVPTEQDGDIANQEEFSIHVYLRGASKAQDRYFGRYTYSYDLDTPTLDAPARWTDGDRVAYRCAWGFLMYRRYLVGRVTYTSIGDPGERAALNDASLTEYWRDYDGTYVGRPERGQFDESCTNPPSGDGISTAGPDHTGRYPDRPADHDFGDFPVLVYGHGPHDIDVRDFGDLADTGVPMHPDLRVQVVAQDERRVTVVGYEQLADGTFRARVEIHFDLMNPGVDVPGTDHPVELRTTLEPEPEPSPDPSPSPSPSPAPSPSPDPAPLTADFDGDGDVDFDDLRAFIEAFIKEFGL